MHPAMFKASAWRKVASWVVATSDGSWVPVVILRISIWAWMLTSSSNCLVFFMKDVSGGTKFFGIGWLTASVCMFCISLLVQQGDFAVHNRYYVITTGGLMIGLVVRNLERLSAQL